LETVSLDGSVKYETHSRTAGGREFHISGYAVLKLPVPNELLRNGTGSRSVSDSMRV